MSRAPRILLSAGEASGDRLGAGLARALRRLRPDVELSGMGGHEMAEAGVRLLQDASEVAVVGLVEVVAHLPAIRRAMARLSGVLAHDRPDLVVPIDFPDFNLRLAGRAAASGIPVVYFVSPQVWAWRRGRIRAIRARVRRMLVLFPFEEAFYRDAGVPVTFVGHPAVGVSPDPGDRGALLARLSLDPGRRVVALLPGSRRGEVRRHLPILLAAAARLRRGRPDLQFVLPLARTLSREWVERHVSRSRFRDVRVHEGDYPELLGACEAGAVASGTATLDAALQGLPMVAIYRVRALTFALGRLLVRVDHVALPNLVLGRRLVPELVQGDCTPDKVAEALASLLDDPPHAERVRAGLAEVRDRLGDAGAFDRAAAAVLRELRTATTT